MSFITGLGAEGLHQREGLRAAVWEVAAGQPHPGGRDLYRSCTTAGDFSCFIVIQNKLKKTRLLLWNCLMSHFYVAFSIRSQIFGICLAQNLVSDIEAVQASWWENHLYFYCFSSVSRASSDRRHTSLDLHPSLSISQHEAFQLFVTV